MADTARLDAENPWPGLATFGEADRAYFRGRDTEADELARLVRRERLTVLFGRSGLGKSSLLAAGLFPRLREDLHLPVYLRIGYAADVSPRRQLWDALAAACAQAQVQAPPPEADESPWAYFHRAGAGFWNLRRRPVLPVLVFDQFEEIFTLGQASEAARAAASEFIEELADLVEDRPSEALRLAIDADPARAERLDFERRGCKVLLSFREDFLAEVEGLRRRMPSLMRNRYRLLPMSATQARAVIASGGPLVGREIAERILGLAWRNQAIAPTEEQAETLEIDPALLSVICTELNLRRRATGAAEIGPELLAGAEAEILSGFYERSLDGLDPRVRHFVEDELITAAGYRDSFAFDDALARPGVTQEALARLIAGRLLRVDERFGVRRLELTHDVLTRVVKDSRDARRAREAEDAARELERQSLKRQELARRRERTAWLVGSGGAVLLAAALWAGHAAVRDYQAAREQKGIAEREREVAERAFAAMKQAFDDRDAAAARAERHAADEQTRAQRASEAAFAQSRLARQLERDARATGLMAAARSAPPEQLPLAVLLGAEAARHHPERVDTQIEQLARLLATQRIRRIVEFDAPIAASAPVNGGRQVLIGTARGELVLIDASDGTERGRWQLALDPVSVHRLQLSPSADGRLVLADVNHVPRLVRLTPGRPAQAENIGAYGTWSRLRLAADGRWLATVGPAGLEISAIGEDSRPVPARRVALPAGEAPRCTSFDATPGRLVVGLRQQTWTVDLANGDITKVALPSEAIAHSSTCAKALSRSQSPDGTVTFTVVDALSGQALGAVQEILATQPRTFVGTPSFAPGDAFVLARGAEELELWPLVRRDGAMAWLFKPRQDASGEVLAASTDGQWLARSPGGRRLELHRRGSDLPFNVAIELAEAPRALHLAADGSSLVAVGAGRLAQVLRLSNAHPLRMGGRPFEAEEIEFSADGRHLGASGASFAGGLAMWDVRDGRPRPVDPTYTTIEFSPDGMLAAAYASRSEVAIFDPGEGTLRPKARLALPSGSVIGTLAIAPGSRRIAIAVQGAILVRDLGDERPARRLDIGKATVRKLAFHPGASRFVAVLDDGSLRIFGAADGGQHVTIPPETGDTERRARSAAFSPDGRWLVVGLEDGTVVRRDGTNGARPLYLSPPREKAAPVTNLVFIEGTSILSAGGLDAGKDFWDIESRRWLGLVGPDAGEAGEGGNFDLAAVGISSRGRRAALRHADATVSIVDWDPESLVREACDKAGRNLSCNEWARYLPDRSYQKTCRALPGPATPCAAR